MDKESYINNIIEKVCSHRELTPDEIQAVVRALRESTGVLQTPYYLVEYHDEFDNTETRIMNPAYSRRIKRFDDDYDIQEDGFELTFRRLVKKEKEDAKQRSDAD